VSPAFHPNPPPSCLQVPPPALLEPTVKPATGMSATKCLIHWTSSHDHQKPTNDKQTHAGSKNGRRHPTARRRGRCSFFYAGGAGSFLSFEWTQISASSRMPTQLVRENVGLLACRYRRPPFRLGLVSTMSVAPTLTQLP